MQSTESIYLVNQLFVEVESVIIIFLLVPRHDAPSPLSGMTQ